MISLSNSTEQVLEPNESITFDLTLLRTCCNDIRHRVSSANVELVRGNIFDIDFSANIAGEAAGPIELSVKLDGEALPESVMVSTPAAANELNNIARPGIRVRKIGCSNTITVTNTGTANIILPAKSALLTIRRYSC